VRANWLFITGSDLEFYVWDKAFITAYLNKFLPDLSLLRSLLQTFANVAQKKRDVKPADLLFSGFQTDFTFLV
jgi:hypothetical protein